MHSHYHSDKAACRALVTESYDSAQPPAVLFASRLAAYAPHREWVTLDRELHPFEALELATVIEGGEAACAARLAALVGVDVCEPGRADRHRPALLPDVEMAGGWSVCTRAYAGALRRLHHL